MPAEILQDYERELFELERSVPEVRETKIIGAPNFPFQRPSFDEAVKSFSELKNCTLSVENGDWFSRSNITGTEYIPSTCDGLKTSDHYNWAARMACDSTTSPSPVRKWFVPKFRKGVESSKFFQQSARTALSLRGYTPSQFRPSSAVALIRKFKSQSWYDPCGGWGDRLTAAQATGVEYYARDVNPLVLAGYAAQANDFGGNVSFELKGAEVDCPARNYFDLCFTSPPYFKAERYQGPDQSWVKFWKLDNWIDGFLMPMLENGWDSLKRGGVLAINISDVYVDHKVNDLCSPVVGFLNAQKVSVNFLGYRMAKRPQSKAAGVGAFCEPIIWGVKN